MKPSDALYYKRVLIELCRSDSRPHDDPHSRMAQNLLAILPHCQNFYVTGDMTAVARAAGMTLPIGSVDSTALPAREGFMVFDAPIGRVDFADADVDIVGIAWQSHWSRPSDSEGIFETVVADEDEMPLSWSDMQVDVWPMLNAAAHGTHALVPAATNPLVWPVGQDEFANEPAEPFGANILATWLLMQQSITAVERSEADRPERRRYARLGLPAGLLIVRLRRIEHVPKSESAGSPDWSHRWLVSGHWRQQFYPSEHGHRPIWINPHVKGPEDRPLVVKERVTAWVR